MPPESLNIGYFPIVYEHGIINFTKVLNKFMKKTIFIILLIILSVFFFPKKDIVAKTTNFKEQTEIITETETDQTEVIRDVVRGGEVVEIAENTHIKVQDYIKPEDVKEIEYLDISFEVSFLSEVGQKLLNEAETNFEEGKYNYTGISSNYLPSDLMAILMKENVDFVISVNTIDVFGNYYSFDESICGILETKNLKKPTDLRSSFKRTAAIQCEQDSYSFMILVMELDYKDPMEEDDYRITTFLIDKEIEKRYKNEFNREYVNLGMFEENDPNGIIIN